MPRDATTTTPGRILAPLQRFARCRRATTALEFALVGPILILLVLMIIENGLMLFAQAVLDNATVVATRQLQINTINTSADFRTAVCSNMSNFFNCANLQFYVNSSPTGFPSVVMPSTSGAFAATVFTPGNPGDYVLAEVAYNRAYVAPWLIKLAGPDWILLATQAFQNEPSL
ncbi:TadE/TadG family type IV pilus assembly protein [Lichenicola sp.]|uniref:TadE/TadG family type IV pilus assembly protein n=1 Tax=Lichenicola sp. TaxID=2804529 RepID=UPI003AFFFDE4